MVENIIEKLTDLHLQFGYSNLLKNVKFGT